MKNKTIVCLAVTGILSLCSCTTVKEQPPATHTTTTTESTTVQPAATETETVHTY